MKTGKTNEDLLVVAYEILNYMNTRQNMVQTEQDLVEILKCFIKMAGDLDE